MLTKFHSTEGPLQLLQTSWANQLNPLLANPLNQASFLKGIHLQIGVNTINHKLQRPLQGWWIVGSNAVASIYDEQAQNQTPDLTLVLNSSAVVTVNVAVF